MIVYDCWINQIFDFMNWKCLMKTRWLYLLVNTEACKTIAVIIVGSRLENCNSLLLAHLFQILLYSLFRKRSLVNAPMFPLSTQQSRFGHITPILYDLHRLPAHHRISYKIITFKVLKFQLAILSRFMCRHFLHSHISPCKSVLWSGYLPIKV